MDQHEATLRQDVSDAKTRLREWGVGADIDLSHQLESAHRQVKRALPWAAGLGVVLGLVTGRKRRARRDEPAMFGAPPARKGAARLFGLAMDILPLAIGVWTRSRARR